MSKKRIQITAGITVDSSSYYQRVHNKDTDKINTIDNQKPLHGTSSVVLETKPYKFTVERTLQPKTEGSASSTPSDKPQKKKIEYDTSQLNA